METFLPEPAAQFQIIGCGIDSMNVDPRAVLANPGEQVLRTIGQSFSEGGHLPPD